MANKDNIFLRIIRLVVLVINILLSIGLIVSAYSGHFSPTHWRLAPLAALSFGIWATAVAIVFVIDLIWWKRTAMVAGLAMLICAPQLHDFCPLNLPRFSRSDQQDVSAFTIMTYNVMQFNNQNTDRPFSSNEQLDYILDQNPDIVCIEESRCFQSNKFTQITQEQLQELSQMYRYIYIDGEDLGLLSKFETRPIHTGMETNDHLNGSIGAWRLKIHGQVVNLFVLHLQSYKLSKEERNLFSEVAKAEITNPSQLREAKNDLVPKVEEATQLRDSQIEQFIKVIEKYGGENVIVCGDFNDTPNSYVVHRLEQECNLKQMYSQVAFGPTITYNAHNFWFRIDHILYRGNLDPISLSRGSIKASDHYPLIGSFDIY